jgi:thioredoxin-dependent peroxiredoxin
MFRMISHAAIVVLLLVRSVAVGRTEDTPEAKQSPGIGDKAPDFALNDFEGNSVSLADQLKHGPTVVVVLRGFPGYQCPICAKQFGELMGKAKKFADAKATVLFVYPGSAADLDKHAREFVGGKTFPANYRFVTDPDFKFTELYKLRWNAPHETAYPSTFVVDEHGAIQFAKVSHSHGDRASGGELLDALTKLSK